MKASVFQRMKLLAKAVQAFRCKPTLSQLQGTRERYKYPALPSYDTCIIGKTLYKEEMKTYKTRRALSIEILRNTLQEQMDKVQNKATTFVRIPLLWYLFFFWSPIVILVYQ